MNIRYSLKHKAISWFLTVALVVTLIPDLGYAAQKPDSDPGPNVTETAYEGTIIEKTEDSTTFDLGNGEYKTIFYGGQIRYKENGVWVDYDPSLEKISRGEVTEQSESLNGYAYQNAAGDKKQYIPENISEDTPVRMEYKDYAIEFSLIDSDISRLDAANDDVKLEKRMISDNYEGLELKPVDAVFGDDKKASVTYTSTNDGVKETLVFYEKPDRNIFRYDLKLTGMHARKNVTDGGVTIYDNETGEITGFISPPWMNDASGDAYSEDIVYTLEESKISEGEYILTMAVSKEYLEVAERQYPVTIDPTISWYGTSQIFDAYVISGSRYGNTNFYESGTKVMPVGKNSTGTHMTFVKIKDLKSTIYGSSISYAEFAACETGTGAANQSVGVYRVQSDWNPSTIRYNNKPGIGTCLSSSITTRANYTRHYFDITLWARQLSLGQNPDYGLALYNTSSGYACFYGSRASAYIPYLSVIYHPVPTAPETVTLSRADNGTFTETSSFEELEPLYTSWSGGTAFQIAEVQYKIDAADDGTNSPESVGAAGTDLTVYRSIGSASDTGTNVIIPEAGYLPKGDYKLSIRLKDASGHVGPEKTVNFKVNGKGPEIGSVVLKDTAGNDITGKFTTQNAHAITFDGISDPNLADTFLKYAVVKSGEDPAAAYKNTDISLMQTDGGKYSGTISNAFTNINEDGVYDVYLQAADRAGNIAKKKVEYKRDTVKPTASLKLTDIEMGAELGKFAENEPVPQYIDVTGSINIEAKVNGTGSEVDAQLKIYSCDDSADGSPGDLIETNERNSVVLIKSFTIDRNLILDTASILGSGGRYRLELTVKDESGLTESVTKDLEIENRLAAPKIKIDPTNDRETTIHWNFSAYPQQKMKLSSLVYRLDENDTWHTLVEPSGDKDVLDFKGKAAITLPESDTGSWTLQIAGRDNAGYVGGITTAAVSLDTEPPSAMLNGIMYGGYLHGTAQDDVSGIDKWQIFVKEKSAESYPDTLVKEGTKAKNSDSLMFVNFTKDPFLPETKYTFKLVVFDKAGNRSEATLDITSPAEEDMTELIEPVLVIDKGLYQQGFGNFTVGTKKEKLSLKSDVTDVSWYIDGEKAAPDLLTPQGTPIYAAGSLHEVIAEKVNEDGTRSYTVPVIKNFDKLTMNPITYCPETDPLGLTGEMGQISVGKLVSFHFETDHTDKMYEFQIGDSEYTELQPDKLYYVNEFDTDKIYVNSIRVREIIGSGETASENQIDVYLDTIDDSEYFSCSEIENYVPADLSANAKINSKTYLTWDIQENMPSNLYYEVYRSTEEGFTPDTPIATVHAGYYTEMNVDHGQEYYYRVCAVLKNTDGSVSQRSSYSLEASAKVTDENEYSKHLGMKDFWEYTEFTTPNGSGYVEKSHGNFLYQQRDAQIPNEGFDVHLTRTYNSQSSTQGAFGFGWTHEYDIELLNICENNQTNAFTNVALKDGNGALYYFTRESSDQEFVSPLGKYVNLTAETTEQTKTVKVVGAGDESAKTLTYKFILDTKDSVSYYFNSGGQLILMEDANGNFVLFEHDVKTGLLTKMLTNNNIAISFVYNTDEQGMDPATVKEIHLPDNSKVLYTYEKPLLSAEKLLKYVTKVSPSEEKITYEYEYHKPLLSSFPRNLEKIHDATKEHIYELEYDYDTDQVKKAIYPKDEHLNGEYITFDYSGWGTETVTTKYSDNEPVMIEKDFFDEITGRCEKSIRGIDDMSDLESGKLLDETTYTYKDELLVSTTQTAEYLTIGDDGFIVQHEGTKVNKVEYEGDAPVKEIEDDGSISEYTYYTTEAGEHLDGLIASEKVISADGKVLEDKRYEYDTNGNITLTIDNVAKTKVEQKYFTEGQFKGELQSRTESLLPENGGDYVWQSTATYGYTYNIEGDSKIKVETCKQERPDSAPIETTTKYDEMGRVVSEKDGRGYMTTYTYDGFGRCIGTNYIYGDETSGNKTSTCRVYDANGMIVSETLEDGIKKTYEYDEMQRVMETTISKQGQN